jgi:uncharacterized protein (TIGR02687 family)
MVDLTYSSQEPQETTSLQEARLFGYADLDTTQIVRGLRYQFEQERHRIVFWNDPDREFTEVVGALALDKVTVIHLDELAALAVKIQVERTDPTGRYLLYMPFEEPPYQDDWLLDIRLYSGRFRADRASMLLAELGLGQNQTLRGHLNQRLKFLNSKERLNRLAKLVSPSDDGIALDRKMLGILARADQAEPFAIVTALLHDLDGQGHGLDGQPAAWEDILKFGLGDAFWEMVGQTFGYKDEKPRLRTLLLRLMVTDFAHGLNGSLPAALLPHVLPNAHVTNVIVCLNQWRDSATRGKSYDSLAAAVSQALHLPTHLNGFSAEALVDVVTFLEVEKQIATELRDRLINGEQTIHAGEIHSLIARRQDCHWASSSLPTTEEAPRRAFAAVYKALWAATELTELMQNHLKGFQAAEARKMVDAYTTDLYRFDQRYRQFCETAALARAEGWDLLKSLQDKVEAVYANGYLTPLSVAWGGGVEQNLLANWQIEGMDNQYRFFARQVKPALQRSDNQKVFVILSDAFRYEAAHELTSELNGKYRFRAELDVQLGVLPSYTALGMAALLPHTTLAYNAKGDVLADGKSTSGLENRSKILNSVSGIAVSADDLLKMKREEGRAFIKDSRVIYIYHDTIDATGDKAATEDETFQAVRRAIDELAILVRHIINSLNGSHVIVTADHGFLFQNTPPDLTDKSVLKEKPDGTIIAKKRYLLGKALPDANNVCHGTTATTAQADGDMEFWIPKGTNLFHFTGGAKFVHGGVMLQEILVPIITVQHLRDKAAESTKTRSVAVHILGTKLKVTTNRHRFQLIQTEAVSERIKPVTLQVAVYDGDAAITNIETVTFDSASNDMADRTKWVSLVFKAQQYDKKKTYALVLRSAEDNIEHQRAEVFIDMAFSNDF